MVFADSINLARRLSTRNEPDLLQENMMSQKRDYAQCQIFAKKISNIKDLPDECFAHKDIVASFQTSSRGGADAPDPFAGMGGAAAAAISARKKGQENYAQIQRRLTNSRRFTKEKK